MTIFIFPGQGSQIKGMGGDLFDKFDIVVAKADAILGYSIAKLCLEDPQDQINQTQFTQPALYVVNALSYYDRIQADGRQARFFAGHSLGEYNALLAAGVFDFETGLKLVKKRGELMSKADNGGMAAIIGLKVDAIKKIIENHALKNLSIANYNSHSQTVISGQKNEVEQAQSYCEQAGARMVIPLKVSGAFHSPLMTNAQNEFALFIDQFKLSAPLVPVISNYTAKPYQEDEIRKNLSLQISNPVRWTETIEYLITAGGDKFEEVGPGTVLSGLVSRIKTGQ